MSETKKLTIVGIILAVLFAISIGIYVLDKTGGFKKFSSKGSSSGKYEIYYLGREGCGYCQLFNPNIENIKKNYNINYTYIDIEEITDDELSNYLTKFEIGSNFGTPTIAVMQGDKFIANHVGYMTEQELYNFLKKYNVIEGEYVSAYPNLTYIDLEDYKEIVNSNSKQLVVIAQEGCTGCDEAQEYLNKIAKEQNLKVNYYNVSFETEDDYDYFYNSYDFIKKALDEEELYTPTFMIVENKQVIDHLSQFTSENDLENLLKTNGLIK